MPNAGGLTVTFGSGQADLSPASAQAIQGLVKKAPSGDMPRGHQMIPQRRGAFRCRVRWRFAVR
jgi:hypothetical protein